MWSHSIYKGSLILCYCCLSFGVKLQEAINYIYQFLLQLLFTKNAFVSFNCYVRYWFDGSGSSSNEVMTVFIVNTFQVFEVGFLFIIHNFNENSFLQYTIVLQGWQFSKRNINTIWFAHNFGNALQGKMLKKLGFFSTQFLTE